MSEEERAQARQGPFLSWSPLRAAGVHPPSYPSREGRPDAVPWLILASGGVTFRRWAAPTPGQSAFSGSEAEGQGARGVNMVAGEGGKWAKCMAVATRVAPTQGPTGCGWHSVCSVCVTTHWARGCEGLGFRAPILSSNNHPGGPDPKGSDATATPEQWPSFSVQFSWMLPAPSPSSEGDSDLHTLPRLQGVSQSEAPGPREAWVAK